MIKSRIDPFAYLAPMATVCGDVMVRAGARLMFGAAIIAQRGAFENNTALRDLNATKAVIDAAHLKANCAVRMNSVVHANSRRQRGATVPIHWVAVGNPAKIFLPDRRNEIWSIQEGCNFPVPRSMSTFGRIPKQFLPEVASRLSEVFWSQFTDEVITE